MAAGLSHYTAYGLAIQSALVLPELISGGNGGGEHVSIELGRINRRPEKQGFQGCFSATPEEALLFWEKGGAFSVKNGNRILVDCRSGVDERFLRACLLGPVLGVLLHYRGLLVLHASAVTTPHGVITFMGDEEWGKSTLAATFYSRGYPLVTDDVLAVATNGVNPTVFPGFPQINIWPESALALGYAPESLPRINDSLEKRTLRADRGFSTAALPLRCIYLIDKKRSRNTKRAHIQPVSPIEAVEELVRHAYCIRLLSSALASYFCKCASLLSQIPVRLLCAPRSLAGLQDLVTMVEEDLAGSVQPAPKRL